MIEIDIFAACLSAIAAVAAAIAAWKSCTTAHKALDFEKRYARNQYTLVQLNSALGKLMKLKTLLADPLGTPDHEFHEVEPLYRECQADLQRLAASGARPTAGNRVVALGDVLRPFAESDDRLADVDRAIAAVEADVTCILQ